MTGERELTPEDFAQEGLLEGVEPDEREARVDLLRQLAARGIVLEELSRAVAQDRLALLPLELLLRGEGRYTFSEYAELSGLGMEFLQRDFLALGFPVPDPAERRFSDRRVAAGRQLKQIIDAAWARSRRWS